MEVAGATTIGAAEMADGREPLADQAGDGAFQILLGPGRHHLHQSRVG